MAKSDLVELVTKDRAVKTAAKNGARHWFFLPKSNVLILGGYSLLFIDVGQVFPHVQDLYGVSGSRNAWQEAVDYGHDIGLLYRSAF